MSEPHEEPRIFQPGDIFRDHYRVEQFLGAGSTGQVYRVVHLFTGDGFALKVGHLKDVGHAKTMARHLITARAGYELRHRNVARVFDLAIEESGLVWQLQELLDGQSVGRLLAGFGRLSPVYAIDVALEIACGLQAAHEQLIIHRDIQPANVFVTAAGVVKLIDFSLAKVIPALLKTTAGRHTMGTRAYMGPEHLKSLPATPHFDVYSLGMLFWTMLVGQHPFQSSFDNPFTLVERQLTEDPASLVTAAGLPAYFDEVIRAATAKDPRLRYPGMWPLMRALDALRERVVADLDAGRLVVDPALCESRYPIDRDPEGRHQYNPPKSLPMERPAPPLPSSRMVVAEGVPVVKRAVAATVPMAAFEAPKAALGEGGATASPRSVAAPTVRPPQPRAQARRPRRLWALLAAPPVLGGLGLLTWVLAPTDTSAPAAPSASATTARAPAPSASSPRRPPAPRQGR